MYIVFTSGSGSSYTYRILLHGFLFVICFKIKLRSTVPEYLCDTIMFFLSKKNYSEMFEGMLQDSLKMRYCAQNILEK